MLFTFLNKYTFPRERKGDIYILIVYCVQFKIQFEFCR